MHSENGVLVDFEEIAKLVESADVFTVGFGTFSERLIVDARSNDKETPLVQIVEPARSVRDRLSWLNRRRPSLGVPQGFSFFAWPHSPSFLVQSGIWERIRRRVDADGDPNVDTQCEMALKQLLNLDAEATMALLKGEHCITLWPPQANQDTGGREA